LRPRRIDQCERVDEGSLDRAFRSNELRLTKKTTEWKLVVFRPRVEDPK